MGSWKEVWSYTEEERLIFFYRAAMGEGGEVNWRDGTVKQSR